MNQLHKRSRPLGKGVARLASLLLLLVLAACFQSGSGPQISSFEATPPQVNPNDEVVLSWKVLNATGLILEAVTDSATGPTRLSEDLEGQERFVVKPTSTATYRLIATGPGGTSSREVTVTVRDDNLPPGSPVIDSFSADPGVVPPGGRVTLSWAVSDADTVSIVSDGGLSLQDVGNSGTHELALDETTSFTLSAKNDVATVTRTLSVQVGAPADAILILIAGQSNATGYGQPFPEGREVADEGVFMLTEDDNPDNWRWVPAQEPTHEGAAHSFGVRLGNELKRATGKDVYLVPSAVGGTSTSEWQPGHGSGYFDTAVQRANFASDVLGVPVSAVTWFQGETDSATSSQRSNFVERTTTIFESFRNRLDGSPPILYAQLSKRLYDASYSDEEPDRNLAYQIIREMQRMMAAGAVDSDVVAPGSSPAASSDDKPYYHMVVAHDLEMSDLRHVGRDGQKVLGSRFAHAFLVNVWTGAGARPDSSDGPQVRAVVRASANTLRVEATRELTVGNESMAKRYFTVFVDGNPLTISSVRAEGGDVVIEVVEPLPADSGQITVRFMPSDDVGEGTSTMDVVYVQDSQSGIRLPLPAFGLSPAEYVPSGFHLNY